ncbi:ABC transporter permease [Mangrovibacterium lignilyticum]|uniref:ABC transporter permease n=1 Tax=Mangrovibacterium lignilyticum TaxID=2668052 RepID=UPI0013D6BDD8|nr:ABC transporter permease subunit [Mangrovibacterium lignilyticum]
MIALIQFELKKLLLKPRTWLSLCLLVLLVALIFWGMKAQGQEAVAYLLQALQANFVIEGSILNAYLVVYLILNTLWIHVPVLVVIVTGDLFSSELENGTIRLLMTRPVKRYQLVLAKQLTAVAFVVLFLMVWMLVTIAPGFRLFGGGDLVVLFNGLQIIEEQTLPLRFLGAFAFALLGMSALAVFSVTVSFFTRRSLVTILITLGVIVVSTLLQTLAPTIFPGWDNFLITYHLAQWQLFFYSQPDYGEILWSVGCLSGFIALAVVVSVIRFQRLKITE